MRNELTSNRKTIANELDAIADLAICASMATHSFDEFNDDEACALRALCRLIAARLREISGSADAG